MRKAGAVSGAVLSRSILKLMGKKFVLCAATVVPVLLLAGASAQQTVRAHLPTTTVLAARTEDATGRTTFSIKVQGGAQGIDGSAPSGAVSLSNGVSSLGSVLLDQNGSATYTTSAGAGLDHITAIYEGDSTFDPSASLSVAVPAASTVPTFALSATPTTLSVKAGNFITTTVTVIPANGFVDTVQLSCSGLPANSTCAFNPTNVVPGGTAPATTAANSTLTIQTTALTGGGTAGSLRRPTSPHTPLYAVLLPGFTALAGLGLLGRRGRKARYGTMRLLGLGCLLLGCGLGLAACSPRYDYFAHPPLTDPGTTIGTFTVLVSGSSATAGTVIIPTPVSIVLTVTK